MIKAEELRIRNILFFNGKVKTINGWDIYCIDKKGMLDPSDLFEPIPLTEEWLLKFGFESFGDWFIIKRFPVSLNVSIKHDKTTFGHNEEYDIENIKYVHQLQNLYWCLCGEELKYSVPA